MTMAAQVTPGTHAPCPPSQHRHEPVKRGGRCAYWSPGRPDNICGRTSVAVYVNDAVTPPMTYRCESHDQEVNRAEAARLGFVRQAVVHG